VCQQWAALTDSERQEAAKLGVFLSMLVNDALRRPALCRTIQSCQPAQILEFASIWKQKKSQLPLTLLSALVAKARTTDVLASAYVGRN
jgi:hypothetical protein